MEAPQQQEGKTGSTSLADDLLRSLSNDPRFYQQIQYQLDGNSKEEFIRQLSEKVISSLNSSFHYMPSTNLDDSTITSHVFSTVVDGAHDKSPVQKIEEESSDLQSINSENNIQSPVGIENKESTLSARIFCEDIPNISTSDQPNVELDRESFSLGSDICSDRIPVDRLSLDHEMSLEEQYQDKTAYVIPLNDHHDTIADEENESSMDENEREWRDNYGYLNRMIESSRDRGQFQRSLTRSRDDVIVRIRRWLGFVREEFDRLKPHQREQITELISEGWINLESISVQSRSDRRSYQYANSSSSSQSFLDSKFIIKTRSADNPGGNKEVPSIAASSPVVNEEKEFEGHSSSAGIVPEFTQASSQQQACTLKRRRISKHGKAVRDEQERRWWEHIDRLIAYKEKHQNFDIDKNYVEVDSVDGYRYELHNWLAIQRVLFEDYLEEDRDKYQVLDDLVLAGLWGVVENSQSIPNEDLPLSRTGYDYTNSLRKSSKTANHGSPSTETKSSELTNATSSVSCSSGLPPQSNKQKDSANVIREENANDKLNPVNGEITSQDIDAESAESSSAVNKDAGSEERIWRFNEECDEPIIIAFAYQINKGEGSYLGLGLVRRKKFKHDDITYVASRLRPVNASYENFLDASFEIENDPDDFIALSKRILMTEQLELERSKTCLLF